uniref:Sulfite exporter TauE/SafE family protein n=1 Tax=Aegilops tauschii subsp. strangulata TaxID=200361 RepID=A0A453QTL4_AEGTS
MIMGAAVSTVYCNLKLKHPTLDMPVIDYDLVLLIQPMLMLGVSIGVICNVIFPDWLVTVLLIILFIVTSTKAFLKAIETWKKETIIITEAAKQSEQTTAGLDAASPSEILSDHDRNETPSDKEVSIWKNVYWKEVGLLAFVWVAFLVLQVAKNYMATCSIWYWVLNLLQIPVSVGVAMYEAVGLVQGRRVISSKRNEQNSLRAHQLFVYCFLGVTAGVVAGLLGVGGGSIMGPLFLELGVPPQVASATATFAMMFSSSMSVVEYYLLNRFPVPYAVYLTILAFFAAIVGQRVVRKLIDLLGRASIIVFILSFMIFISALSLGGVGISNTIHKIERHEYMGFENICKYEA